LRASLLLFQAARLRAALNGGFLGDSGLMPLRRLLILSDARMPTLTIVRELQRGTAYGGAWRRQADRPLMTLADCEAAKLDQQA
jgi:hypothetical protein